MPYAARMGVSGAAVGPGPAGVESRGRAGVRVSLARLRRVPVPADPLVVGTLAYSL